MDKIHDELVLLNKQWPAAADNPDAIEKMTDVQLAALLKQREAIALKRSQLAAKAVQTTGNVPYELAWGTAGVADIILS